ncbi:MAG TPA: 16S rRNA (uracil(1498)-N(3))-methyltransferase [Burkholderiales bacterium]|jgi:16S rRNA (uracil1498-N3)-methyltransferase|nr:16S rRNA (uracil(1498)-N(3))-methyltransferase [Burkholderiales bacterium]
MNDGVQKKAVKPGARFFFPDTLGNGSEVRLPSGAAHHAARVLRLTIGDPLVLFNGRGGEYQARIVRLDRGEVWVKTGGYTEPQRESPIESILAQGVCSGDRMDLTLQKSVELGVSGIQPLMTERSVVRLTAERAARRAEHWQNLVVSACEQCGRNTVPRVAALLKLEDWLARLPVAAPRGELRLLLSPTAEVSFKVLPKAPARVLLLVGPEGGLSGAEVAAALGRGFLPVRLGPRILRTETAALAALAGIQALWGDF